MENNKYYTPQIEEFCVGFECEFKHYNKDGDEVWEKRIINVGSFQKDSYEQLTYTSNWRVKYLDEQDILELGFSFFGENNKTLINTPVKMYHNDDLNLMLGHYYTIGQIVLATKDPSKSEIYLKLGQDPNRTGFLNIKNKNELQKLIKQLERCT